MIAPMLGCSNLFFTDFLDDQHMLLAGRDGMRCIDLNGNISELFFFGAEKYNTSIEIEMCALDESRQFLAVWTKPDSYYDRLHSEALDEGFVLSVYRTDGSGAIWEDKGTEDFYGVLNTYTQINDLLFSEDSRYLAAAVGDPMETIDRDDVSPGGMVVVVDLEDNSCQSYISKQMNMKNLVFLPEERLAAFGICPETAWEFYEYPLAGEVTCLGLKAGTSLWTYPLSCQMRKGNSSGLFYDAGQETAKIAEGETQEEPAKISEGNVSEGDVSEDDISEEIADSMIGVWCHRGVVMLNERSGLLPGVLLEEEEVFRGKEQRNAGHLKIGAGNRAAFYEEETRQILVLDLESMEIRSRIPMQAEKYHCVFDFFDAGTKIVLADQDGYLKLYDADTGKSAIRQQRTLSAAAGRDHQRAGRNNHFGSL